MIYHNIARPVRRILDALDAYSDLLDDDADDFSMDIDSKFGTPDTAARLGAPSPGFSNSNDPSDQTPSVLAPSVRSDYEVQLGHLRDRLSPLLDAEAELAERLSGGIDVSGSGKGNVFVRSGWQARSLLGKGRGDDTGGRRSVSSATRGDPTHDLLCEHVASVLASCKDDIRELWEHPAVRRLRDRRKLRLEEWAELLANLPFCPRKKTKLTFLLSFLDNIIRVSSTGYVPTMGKSD